MFWGVSRDGVGCFLWNMKGMHFGEHPPNSSTCPTYTHQTDGADGVLHILWKGVEEWRSTPQGVSVAMTTLR